MEDVVSYVCTCIISELNGGNEAVQLPVRVRNCGRGTGLSVQWDPSLRKGFICFFHLINNHNFLFGLC